MGTWLHGGGRRDLQGAMHADGRVVARLIPATDPGYRAVLHRTLEVVLALQALRLRCRALRVATAEQAGSPYGVDAAHRKQQQVAIGGVGKSRC